MNNSCGLDTLTGPDNFLRWIRNFRILAQAQGLWNLYAGWDESLPRPEPNDSITSEFYNATMDDFKENQARLQLASTFLACHVHPAIRARVDDFTNPRAAFDTVVEMCRVQDKKQMIQALLQEIGLMELEDYGSITNYVNEMTLLHHDLGDVGAHVSDREFLRRVLRGLPSSYHGMKVRLLSPASASNSWASNLEELLFEERRIDLRQRREEAHSEQSD